MLKHWQACGCAAVGAAQRSSARTSLRSGACPSTFDVLAGSGNEGGWLQRPAKDRMADQQAALAAAVAVRRLAGAERPRERASKQTN